MNKKDKTPAVHKRRGTHAEIERKHNRWVVIGFSITAVIIILLIGFGILNETVLKFRATVASLGNEKISAQEFIERVKFLRSNYIAQFQNYLQYTQIFASDAEMLSYINQQLVSYQNALDDSKQIGQNVLDQMIIERIFAIEAEKKGVSVSEQEIDEFFQSQFLGYYPKGTPTPIATDVVFATPTYSATQKTILNYTPMPTAQPTEVVTQESMDISPTATETIELNSTPEPTATPYTKELYEKNFMTYIDDLKVNGISEKTIRDYIKFYLLQVKLRDAYNQDPESSEQVWARHILVKTEVEGEIVISRIANGEDWAAVASEVSLDTGTKDAGGDLGWFARGAMVTTFEDAAFALNIGEISSPIQSDFGWHVIQVIGHDSLAMAFDSWIAQVKSSMEIVKKNWENTVPSEPTIPAELRVSEATQ